MTWANFSAWVLAAGLVMGVAVLSVIDWPMGAWRECIDQQAGVLSATASLSHSPSLLPWIHSRDAWTPVVPVGFGLPAAVMARRTFE